MSSLPKAKESILEIAPYVGGESGLSSETRPPIKLSSNEGALGVSPKVVEAIKESAMKAHRYPEGGGNGATARTGAEKQYFKS